MIISFTIRVNTKWLDDEIQKADDKRWFFGIKGVWGYIHLILYIILGYNCGLNLFPFAMTTSILWETFEALVENATNGIIKTGGALDVSIDMTGYVIGSYWYLLKKRSIEK